MKKIKKIITTLMCSLALIGGGDKIVNAKEYNNINNTISTNSNDVITINKKINIKNKNYDTFTYDGYSNVVYDLITYNVYNTNYNYSGYFDLLWVEDVLNINNELDTFIYLVHDSVETNFDDIDPNITLRSSYVENIMINVNNEKLIFPVEIISWQNSSDLFKYRILSSEYYGSLNDYFDTNINRKYIIEDFTIVDEYTTLYDGEYTEYWHANQSHENNKFTSYSYKNNGTLRKYDGENLIVYISGGDNNSDTTISKPSTDLKFDSTFDLNNYPELRNQFSLDIIQVAESVDGELFIYVYNPSLMLKATSINMSINLIDYKLYNLELLSSDYTIDKYLVKGFLISNDEYRYYSIASIYRNYNNSLDVDNTLDPSYTSSIAHEVGKRWCIYNINGTYHYECEKENVANIKMKIGSFVSYAGGVKGATILSAFLINDKDYTISFFVGFNIENYSVDKIYDADLVYNKTTIISQEVVWPGKDYYSKTTENDIPIYLDAKDEVSYKGSGLFAKTYKWKRIMSSVEFVENYKASGGELHCSENDLKSYDWVFAFDESYGRKITGLGGLTSEYYEYSYPEDVKILRIKFLSRNKTYNLGVVSNGVSSDGTPSGTNDSNKLTDAIDELKEKISQVLEILKYVILVVIVVVVVSLLSPVLVLIMPLLKSLFAIIKEIISIPFKWVSKLFNKRN